MTRQPSSRRQGGVKHKRTWAYLAGKQKHEMRKEQTDLHAIFEWFRSPKNIMLERSFETKLNSRFIYR